MRFPHGSPDHFLPELIVDICGKMGLALLVAICIMSWKAALYQCSWESVCWLEEAYLVVITYTVTDHKVNCLQGLFGTHPAGSCHLA